MSDLSKTPGESGRFNCRRYLKLTPAVAAAGLLVANPCGSAAHRSVLTKEQRDKMTPDHILAELKRGSARFRKGEEPKRDFLAEQKAPAKAQYPAAGILSCIDSRAPAEVIMDLGLGNVFNCRVAGNVLNEEIVGSMEFACKAAGAKVVLVMGHTSCGAIRGAIGNVKLGNLTALLSKIRPAVKVTQFNGERTSKNPAFVGAVARKNVALTMAQILKKSPVLRELQSKGAIKVAGTMYRLDGGTVDFFA
jgi:carbonic anhydrase